MVLAATVPFLAHAQSPDQTCRVPNIVEQSGGDPDHPITPDTMLVEVWRHVATEFVDPNLSGVDWPAAFVRHCPAFALATSREDRAKVINAMLSELGTSHTRLYTPDTPAYYQLLGVFLPNMPALADEADGMLTEGRPRFSGIGIETEMIDGRVHVRGVLQGGPADEAGILRGDEILSVGEVPFHPIRSFEDRGGQSVPMRLRRVDDAAAIKVTVTPRLLDGAEMFLDAMEASITVENRGALRIGYVRLWSYAGPQYQELLEGELLYGRLRDVDALVLDLRGGWGGASPTYLNLFRNRAVTLTTLDRTGVQHRFASAWERPTVLLVDETSRSGKEIIAWGFQTLGIGPVVGGRTAGAVLSGRLMPMSDGNLLYLAVQEVLVDGRRLEGVGVMPDYPVPAPLAYAAGKDPQRAVAFDLAAEAARQR